MSKNRIVYALLTDHTDDGKIAILQRCIISPGKILTDALDLIDKHYPTAKFESWVTTYVSYQNGASDIKV